MSKFKILSEMDFKNKTVLLRADFNLPVDEQGNILSDWRIKKTLKTINYLLDQNVKLIIATHFGRPKGQIVEELRVNKIADRLSEILQKPVKKLDTILGAKVKEVINQMSGGEVLMLENIQFEAGEIENSEEYSQELANYADIFVLDAFGQAHRNYASLVGIQRFIPSCAGLVIQEEIENLSKLIESPAKPFYAIIGGLKSDKIGVMKSFVDKVDKFLIGGVLANTFLKARGLDIGASKFDEKTLDFARDFLNKYSNKIMLPEDLLVSNKFENESEFTNVNVQDIPQNKMALDIGQASIENYKKILANAQTIIWAGTMGVFEFSNFSQGTREIANFIATLESTTIIGGGDTVTAIENLELEDKMNHVSTGGGAALEFLAGNELPALKALEKNYLKFN
jgi:phosphoglycerate kinase